LALRQDEVCLSALAEEFGISPLEDSQALYTQIFIQANDNYMPVVSQEQIHVDQALRQLREASHAIDLAKEQIQQVLQVIAKISGPSEQKFLSNVGGF
jgi:hypothetical protein